jgi:hypothetical protein
MKQRSTILAAAMLLSAKWQLGLTPDQHRYHCSH